MKFVANSDDADSVAAAWAVRLDAGDLSDVERQELEAWLERDVRHVGALVRAEAVWLDLDRVAALRAGADAPMALSGEPRRRRPRTPRWLSRKNERFRLGLAAAAAALITVGAVGGYQYFDGRLVANKGEVRRVALDDGSTVILDSSAIVQVRFARGERTVYLKRGDASFQVAHDRSRPFVVHAGDVAVRAVGTNFAVGMQPDKVSVTVAEGVVEVKRPGPVRGVPERRLVGRNVALTAQREQPMKAAGLSEAQLARKLAWRDGLLMFDGETVGQAAVEVNRYAALRVVIDDPKLAGKTFVGVFRLGDSKAFANTAAAAYDDKVVEADDALHIAVR
jgi:transmembrane sensor